jgi:predicted nucleic-acid-binding Zn-ribbon protein
MSLCPNCKEKINYVVKEIRRPPAANCNQWNEEQDKTHKSWSCSNCGFHGSQTTYHKNRRKKKLTK